MTSIKLKFKKDQFPFQLTPDITLQVLRTQIYALTSIPPEKQKLVCKGAVIKSEQQLLSIKGGSALLIMGTPEGQEMSLKPDKQIKFIQDLTPQEKAKLIKEKTGMSAQVGLQNLGNTCYMNSTLQYLKRINQLREHITTSSFNKDDVNGLISHNYAELMKYMDNGVHRLPITNVFVQLFRNYNPEFAQVEHGQYMQQDADEFLLKLLNHLHPCCNVLGLDGERENLIEKLFTVHYQASITNQQIQGETRLAQQKSLKQICIIDNQGNPINTLEQGIKASLQTSIEMNSIAAGRNCLFKKEMRISQLPNYLMVQMIRFFWKEADQTSGTKATKSKILRSVAFPKILNVMPFCTQKLQKILQVGRELQKKKKQEEELRNKDRFQIYKKEHQAKGNMIEQNTSQLYKKFKETIKEQEIKRHDQQLYKNLGFGLDTGYYQLVGVITHQGRTANSGHYVGWTHETGDVWSKYDDDVVSTVKIQDVLDLKGGGDWHMAYFLLYRKLQVQ